MGQRSLHNNLIVVFINICNMCMWDGSVTGMLQDITAKGERGQENKKSGGWAQTWDLCSNMDFQPQSLNIDSDRNPLAPHWKARNVDHTTKFDA